MKKITLSLFVLFSLVTFGQEKEIKEAFSAYDSGNKAQAQTLIQQADAAIGNKSASIDPAVYAKYLYVKGNTLLEQGKTLEAAQAFSELNSYEKGPVYSLKNKETKEKAYVLSKAEADKLQTSGFSGLKETNSGTDYGKKVITVLDAKRQEIANKATEEYSAKNYSQAADDFLQTHYLYKATGADDEIYKYYAAVTYHAAGKNDKALQLYKELINDGYTGVKTNYTALDKDKKLVNLTKEQYTLFKAAGSSGFSDFKEEITPSVESDLYNYSIGIFREEKKYDEALTLAEKGLSKLPQDKNLNEVIGELYYQTGQTDKYIAKMQSNLQKNPNDYLSLYNLGVIYSKDPKTAAKAKEYYEKVIQLKPDYSAAYLNLASLSLAPDKEIVEQMKALGTTKAEQQKYDNLLVKRKEMFRGALPYLEKARANDSKDLTVVQALREAYRVLGMRDKMMEMDQILKAK